MPDVTLRCGWCGVDFTAPHKRGPKPTYCTPACRQRSFAERQAARRAKTMGNLENCLLRIACAAHPHGTGGHDRVRYYRMACEALGAPVDYSPAALASMRRKLAEVTDQAPDAPLNDVVSVIGPAIAPGSCPTCCGAGCDNCNGFPSVAGG